MKDGLNVSLEGSKVPQIKNKQIKKSLRKAPPNSTNMETHLKTPQLDQKPMTRSLCCQRSGYIVKFHLFHSTHFPGISKPSTSYCQPNVSCSSA